LWDSPWLWNNPARWERPIDWTVYVETPPETVYVQTAPETVYVQTTPETEGVLIDDDEPIVIYEQAPEVAPIYSQELVEDDTADVSITHEIPTSPVTVNVFESGSASPANDDEAVYSAPPPVMPVFSQSLTEEDAGDTSVIPDTPLSSTAAESYTSDMTLSQETMVVADTPPADVDADLVLMALAELGYYTGEFNNRLDTEDARVGIRQYQQAYGLPQTEVLTPDIQNILLQQGDTASQMEILVNTDPQQGNRIQRIQAALYIIGDYDDEIDGLQKQTLTDAIMKYQVEAGSQATGQLTSADEEQLVGLAAQQAFNEFSGYEQMLAEISSGAQVPVADPMVPVPSTQPGQ
jgi:peptidoglycan hydrolase-like protein with peptidoglycan-binding domain